MEDRIGVIGVVSKDKSLKRLINSFNEKIRPIQKFHEELLTRMLSSSTRLLGAHSKGEEYTMHKNDTIGTVFVSVKYELLRYAPFIVQCTNLMKRIEEMMDNEFMSYEIKGLENFMRKEMEKSGNRSHPTSIRSLLTFPVQHLLR